MTGRNIKEGKGLVWGVREGGQSVAGGKGECPAHIEGRTRIGVHKSNHMCII